MGHLARNLSHQYLVVASTSAATAPANADRAMSPAPRTSAHTVAVIEQLDLHRPVLAGQSLGGRIAVLTAAAHTPTCCAASSSSRQAQAAPTRTRRSRSAQRSTRGRHPSPQETPPSRSSAAGLAVTAGRPDRRSWTADGARLRLCRDGQVLEKNARRSFRDEWTSITRPTRPVRITQPSGRTGCRRRRRAGRVSARARRSHRRWRRCWSSPRASRAAPRPPW